MRIHVGWAELLMLGAAGAVVLLVVGVRNRVRRAQAPEPPPPLLSLSTLSALSFLTAVGTLLAALSSLGCAWAVRYRDVLSLGDGEVHDVLLAAQVLAWVTLLPAVGTVALAIAARGTIRESRGGVRGRSLYHSAVLVALLSCAGIWAHLA